MAKNGQTLDRNGLLGTIYHQFVVVVIEFINNNTYLFSRWNEDMTPSTSSTSTSSSSVVNDSMLEMTIYDVRRYYRFTFAMTNT